MQLHPHERLVVGDAVPAERLAVAAQALGGREDPALVAEEADPAVAGGDQVLGGRTDAPPALSLSTLSASMNAGGRSTNTSATPASRSARR